MTPADIDPSLRAEPVLESLEDGFSPPPAAAPEAIHVPAVAGRAVEPDLPVPSPFQG